VIHALSPCFHAKSDQMNSEQQPLDNLCQPREMRTCDWNQATEDLFLRLVYAAQQRQRKGPAKRPATRAML
jgi:hypothetical protein